MRLFLASDIHGSAGKLKSALGRESYDLIVLAGDLSNGSLKDVRRILRRAKEFGPVVFVPGNMDPPPLLEVEEVEGCPNLHGRVRTIEMRFGGLGGGNISPFSTPIELDEDEMREVLSKLSGIDVLVSHAPPHDTKLDVIRSGAHVGSKALREYVEREQPLLCVCGHIHESPGVDRIGRTVLVNAGPMMRGRYAVIEVRGDEVIPSLKILD
ncbi:MAG: metallophosphoesterase family protein [Candidatus Korarchaeota archaeon]|nr:metallophosphoesterase family protein [Candidatus Korarchaeota archaeon]